MVPAVIAWSLLAAVTIGLALYRKSVAVHEDDLIHLAGNTETLISQQVHTAETLERVDRWGKILTVATVIFGLLLAAIAVYQAWQQSLRLDQ